MIDKNDKKILKALIENARLSSRQIAEKTGLSNATVSKRLKILESKKVIQGYHVSLDYTKMDYNIEVVIEIIVKKGREETVMESVSKNTNVSCIFDISGAFDILILARFHNREELNEFLKDLRKSEFVERTHTRLILDVFKKRPVKF